MNLVFIHKLLIALAIIFCAGLALRYVASGDGEPGAVLRGAASAVGAILLGFYLRWFVRAPASAATVVLRRESRRDN